MEKGIKNADAIACKLRLALTKVANNRLEVAREKRRKMEEMMEKQKAKAMAAKWQRTRKGISLSSKEEDKNGARDDINPNQANNKYSLQL